MANQVQNSMPIFANENEELLSEIEKIATLGSYEVDLKTGMWRGSDNFIKIFGLPRKDKYTQKEFQSIVHPDDYEEVMDFFQECLEKQKDFNYQYRCIRPDGKVIHVNSRSKISYDEDGEPKKVFGVKQDITEQKKSEQKLIRLNKLIQKKDEILGEVAHDLRAPLAQIMMLANLLEEKLQDEEKKLFSLLKETCDTTDDIISELIEIAEMEDFNYELEKSVTNFNKVIEQSIQCYKPQLENKNLELKTSLSSGATAFTDKKKIRRVVDNLLSNAIKFTPEGNAIFISTKITEDQIKLIVEDEGIGIKKEHLSHLFDPYSKPIRRQGTNGETSTGLGLNIIKQIVDLHNGDIKVTSAFNEGTTFTVTLSRNLTDSAPAL